jgi:hypothetical protein
LNNNQTHEKREERFLGRSHPHSGLQHGHDEVVHKKNCDEWMEEWVKWILRNNYDNSPLVGNETNPFKQTYGPYFPINGNKEEGVRFLSSTPYGSEYGYGFELVKRGNWDIFAAPYVIFNADLEYPSLDKKELFDLAHKQVESVSKCVIVLDGHSLECCRVTIEHPFEVDRIPDMNVMGIDREELRQSDHKVNVVCDGYALFLNPLSPGLHTLRFEAYSPTYRSSVDMLMNVRGPKTKTHDK